jgi:3-oxoacyl-[acyl-carrier-protein] synthase-1
MTHTKVAVTGFGVISPLGRGPCENSSSLQAGKSGIVSRRPEWSEARLRSQVSGKLDVEPLRELFDRKQNRFLCDAALLGAVAMRDAIEHCGLSQSEVEDPRTGLIMGTGAGASMPDAVADHGLFAVGESRSAVPHPWAFVLRHFGLLHFGACAADGLGPDP